MAFSEIDKDFLSVLLKERYGILPLLRKNAEDIKDCRGCAAAALAGSLRFIGITEYLVNNDIQSFRNNLKESAAIRHGLFLRSNMGQPISESYVQMLSYKHLFDALAAGDMRLGYNIAVLMGGRDKLEKEHDHPFDYAFGYALKAFVQNNPAEMEKVLPKIQLDLQQKHKP